MVWINSRGSPRLYIARKTKPIIQRVQRPTILHYFSSIYILKIEIKKELPFYNDFNYYFQGFQQFTSEKFTRHGVSREC